MKKLILTSPAFAGELHVVYGPDGSLLLFDLQPAELTDEQKAFFKQYVPVVYDPATFLSYFGKSKLKVVDEDYEVSFEMFWEKYDSKINKDRCKKIWDDTKFGKARQIAAYAGIDRYNRHLAQNPWKSKLNPENYLKNKAWENEYK